MKAIHDSINSRVVLEDNSAVCFHTTTFNIDEDYACEAEVIDTVVEMFNSGASLTEIDTYLLDAPCSQDVREIIVEGFYVIYQKNV